MSERNTGGKNMKTLLKNRGGGGAYGARGVLEIETIQELINADSNGNARAIRACYGQCGFDSVFRGGG